MKKAVISLSGGMDSTCLLMELLSNDYEVKAYSFDYGQKHKIELEKVQNNIKFLQDKGFRVTHQIINLRDVFSDSNSALHEGGGEIPHDHYAAENQKVTVVENRNVIFSSIIYGKALAWANKLNELVDITLGIHSGDHCFTKDTKILTPTGYKTIENLQVGDSVYSLDSETGKVEVDKCLDIIHKGQNNEIYNIKTTSGTVKLTAEHEVYVIQYGTLTRSGFDKKIIKKKVKDLVVGDIMITSRDLHTVVTPTNDLTINIGPCVTEFLANKGYDVEINQDLNIITPISSNGKHMTPYNIEMNAKSLLNIMAWYITEGSTTIRKDKRASKFISTFTQSAYKNIENCENINSDLTTLNIPISCTQKITENGMVQDVTYQFNSVMSILMQTCGCNSLEKHIPDWMMSFLIKNPYYIYEFLCTLVEGDGHFCKISGIYSFVSKSQILLEQVSLLAKLCGYFVKIVYGKHLNTIYFGNKCRKQGLVNYGDAAMTKISEIIIDNSKLEDVYDISVEKNHNFFAGDFGNVLISNSIYPDCRPESQEAAEHLYKISNWGSERVDYIAPFVNINKSQVLKHGVDAMRALNFTDDEVNFILKNTHTCYDVNENGESCGECGSCRERLEAFEENHMKDPVTYRK